MFIVGAVLANIVDFLADSRPVFG